MSNRDNAYLFHGFALRLLFDRHYLLAALAVGYGRGTAVRGTDRQVAVDKPNAGRAFQWNVHIG